MASESCQEITISSNNAHTLVLKINKVSVKIPSSRELLMLLSATTTISILKLGMALTYGYARALSMFSFVGLLMVSFNRSQHDLSFTPFPSSASINVISFTLKQRISLLRSQINVFREVLQPPS